MKKLIAMLLAAFMVAGMAGCASNGVSQAEYDKVLAERDALQSQLEAMGEKQNDTGEPKPTADANAENSNEFLAIELKEYGYAVSGDYLHYSFILHNPNEQHAVEFPTVRITARDAGGLVLGTEVKVLSLIYPQQDFAYGGMGFEVSEQPSNVEFEVVAPDDYNIMRADMMEHPEYIPMEISGTVLRDDSVFGEVNNKNGYNIDNAIITVVFRDESGKLLSGDSTFADKISAGGSVPFEVSPNRQLMTDSFEVYANTW